MKRLDVEKNDWSIAFAPPPTLDGAFIKAAGAEKQIAIL
jgi:hypothetical protein